MPITGRQPADCFKTFRDHLGPVLAATLGPEHPVICRNDGYRSSLSLGPPSSVTGVRLNSSRGSFFFSMRQNLEVVQTADKKSWQLKTREYRYAIYESDAPLAEAVMRWDYVSRVPPGKLWCKHHFQLGRVASKAVSVPFNSSSLDLNRLHTPTGFVLIEYVLRFLLTDMGVTPAHPDWEAVLDGSISKFFTDFSGRTS